MERWQIITAVGLMGVPVAVILWYRYVVSDERRIRNARVFTAWLNSSQASARVFRGLWIFLVLCAIWRVIIVVMHLAR
jgi:hypothetical protein